jgi:hypothetical protein
MTLSSLLVCIFLVLPSVSSNVESCNGGKIIVTVTGPGAATAQVSATQGSFTAIGVPLKSSNDFEICIGNNTGSFTIRAQSTSGSFTVLGQTTVNVTNTDMSHSTTVQLTHP